VSNVLGLSILLTESDFMSLELRGRYWTLEMASKTGAEIFMASDIYGAPYMDLPGLFEKKRVFVSAMVLSFGITGPA
jgi:hypothetical protein